MKKQLENMIAKIARYVVFAWVIHMLDAEYFCAQTGIVLPFTKTVAIGGGTIVAYLLWFYVLPKTVKNVYCLFRDAFKDPIQRRNMMVMSGFIVFKIVSGV